MVKLYKFFVMCVHTFCNSSVIHNISGVLIVKKCLQTLDSFESFDLSRKKIHRTACAMTQGMEQYASYSIQTIYDLLGYYTAKKQDSYQSARYVQTDLNLCCSLKT